MFDAMLHGFTPCRHRNGEESRIVNEGRTYGPIQVFCVSYSVRQYSLTPCLRRAIISRTAGLYQHINIDINISKKPLNSVNKGKKQAVSPYSM